MAFTNEATNQQWCLSLDHPNCKCPDRGTDPSVPICRRWNWMECSQSSCWYHHVCSGCLSLYKECPCPCLQGLSCTHHSANEALQGRPGRTTHQTGPPFAAIKDMFLGSSETPTHTISTHNRTSDHVKHSYDSNLLADSNQPATKNSEGMIHDKYNPPDNLQSTLIYPPHLDKILKILHCLWGLLVNMYGR